MSIAQTFLHEFERESRTTRRFLERVPADKLSWRPHPKSLTAGQLALHIAAAQGGIIEMAMQSQLDAPDFSRPFPQPASHAEIMAALDDSEKKVRRLLPELSDEKMAQTWRMLKGGQPVMEMPRAGVIRYILMNHIYHHRGQLGVYLRLLGAQVPTAYGPSGDEEPDGTPRRQEASTN